MKKNIITIMMVLATLLMTQCKKQANPVANECEEETVEVRIHFVSNTDKTNITPEGAVTWKRGDRIYIVSDGSYGRYQGYVSAVEDGDEVDFEGRITRILRKSNLLFYYVGDQTFTPSGTNTSLTFDISQQDGTLEGIAAHNQLMYGKTSAQVNAGATDFGTITMNSLISVARMNISCNGQPVSPITVSGLSSVTFDTKTFTGTLPSCTPGDITLTFPTLQWGVPTVESTDCYIALLPGTQTLHFSGNGAEATLGEKTVEPNKLYSNNGAPLEVTMTSSVETDEWVNFNDPTMGVEGMPLWAKYNIGVNTEHLENAYNWYGDYYAWGELVPYYNSITWNAYSSSCTVNEWNNTTVLGCGGYVNSNKGAYSFFSYSNCDPQTVAYFIEWEEVPYYENGVLKPNRDIAQQHAEWGDGWRMPTQAEWKALKDNTYWVYINSLDNQLIGYNGIELLNGYVVYKVKNAEHKGQMNEPSITSQYNVNTDTHLFFPSVGNFENNNVSNVGTSGDYWSATLDLTRTSRANAMGFGPSIVYVNPEYAPLRYQGNAIRPVQDISNASNKGGFSGFGGENR